MEIKQISSLIKVTNYDATNSYIVKVDNETYALKCLKCNTNVGATHLWVEMFSYLYLQKLGCKQIPNICILEIDDLIIAEAKNNLSKQQESDRKNMREIESLSNIIQSKGLNLGIKWIK